MWREFTTFRFTLLFFQFNAEEERKAQEPVHPNSKDLETRFCEATIISFSIVEHLLFHNYSIEMFADILIIISLIFRKIYAILQQ
jgi:hypothetical protein